MGGQNILAKKPDQRRIEREAATGRRGMLHAPTSIDVCVDCLIHFAGPSQGLFTCVSKD
jgi:hypothetical protein